jgi:hypothetical protein
LIVAPRHTVYVRWSCSRCGHTGGRANTTFPVDLAWNDEGRAVLVDQLRKKLVRTHQKQMCIALPSDFVIEWATPHGDRL